MALGRDIDFVGHIKLINEPFDLGNLSEAENIIIKTDQTDKKWIEETSAKIGDWRAYFRSTYIRWALSINGLHVAAEKYSETEWKKNKKFYVKSVRMNKEKPFEAVIIEWDGDTAAKSHLETVKMLNGWGLIDLCGCIEEFVFDFYKIFLRHNPHQLIKDPQYKKLKKLYNESKIDSSRIVEWEKSFEERFNDWQRKKLYDGIHKVFYSYCNMANIKKPSTYKTTPDNWAESIEGVFIIRNALVHGQKKVTKEIAEFCKKPNSMAFKFNEGDNLEITLLHLMALELFTNQLLTAINLSLLEYKIGS